VQLVREEGYRGEVIDLHAVCFDAGFYEDARFISASRPEFVRTSASAALVLEVSTHEGSVYCTLSLDTMTPDWECIAMLREASDGQFTPEAIEGLEAVIDSEMETVTVGGVMLDPLDVSRSPPEDATTDATAVRSCFARAEYFESVDATGWWETRTGHPLEEGDTLVIPIETPFEAAELRAEFDTERFWRLVNELGDGDIYPIGETRVAVKPLDWLVYEDAARSGVVLAQTSEFEWAVSTEPPEASDSAWFRNINDAGEMTITGRLRTLFGL
jgi:hypothetical protein